MWSAGYSHIFVDCWSGIVVEVLEFLQSVCKEILLRLTAIIVLVFLQSVCAYL